MSTNYKNNKTKCSNCNKTVYTNTRLTSLINGKFGYTLLSRPYYPDKEIKYYKHRCKVTKQVTSIM